MTAPIAMPMIAPRGMEPPEGAASTMVTVETTPLASVDVIMRSVAVGMILTITAPFSSVVEMVRGPAGDREGGDEESDRDGPLFASEFPVDGSDGVGGSGSGSG